MSTTSHHFYSVWSKWSRVVPFIIFLVCLVACAGPLQYEIEASRPNILTWVFIWGGLSLFALCSSLYPISPDLKIEGNTIHLRIGWKWRHLDSKKLIWRLGPTMFGTARVSYLILASDDLPIFYRTIGWKHWSGKKCFIVTSAVHDFKELRSYLQNSISSRTPSTGV